MNLFFLFVVLALPQGEIPYKPSDEFQVNIELKMKTRPSEYNGYIYSPSGERLYRRGSEILPFLEATVVILKLQDDEAKVEITDMKGKIVMKRKTSPKLSIHIDIGFEEDLKNRTTQDETTLTFFSKEKKKVRKIVLNISSDGVFKVNGKWNGQF